MDNVKIIDGRRFTLVSEGLYRTNDYYPIIDKTDWIKNIEHEGMVVLGDIVNGQHLVEYISINEKGSSSLTEILNKDYNGKFCFEALPKSNALLGVYDCVN